MHRQLYIYSESILLLLYIIEFLLLENSIHNRNIENDHIFATEGLEPSKDIPFHCSLLPFIRFYWVFIIFSFSIQQFDLYSLYSLFFRATFVIIF